MKKTITILYEDSDYLVCEKPANLLVHPSREAPHEKMTLMSLLKEQTGHYLYPLHRLDRPVSGIVIFALSPEAGNNLKEIWNTDKVEKKYLLLCKGQIEEEGEFHFDLQDEDGLKKKCLTKFKRFYQFEDTAFCEASLFTGRRHQIRRHFARRQHNLVGDKKHGRGSLNKRYQEEFDLNRIFLHAYKLRFWHVKLQKDIEIKCPLSYELHEILKKKNYPESLENIWL